ncbi:hypothetical protein Nepgr_030973 [Nepenthes gracilis]|uniref:Uncharacterized protein n=1 Tax=Nepenthes gracilis TaxID=150966 RepID=A0AAD3Y6C2_NEPGR|nr:hypothetical protein Nepgr_030973 [Nepenthes gracilis]
MGDNPGSTQITIPMEVTPPHIETPQSEILPSEGDNLGSTRITIPKNIPLDIETPELEIHRSESTEPSDSFADWIFRWIFPRLVGKFCRLVLLSIVLIIIVPFALLYAFAVYFICNKNVTEDTDNDRQPKDKGIYRKVQRFQGTAVQIAKLASVIHNRIMILLLMWLTINVSVRSLRRKIVLGSELWKWSLLIVILSCGYLVISAVVRILLHYITKLHIDKKNVAYLARGLRKSINLIIFSILVLLTWHFYFCSDHGLR